MYLFLHEIRNFYLSDTDVNKLVMQNNKIVISAKSGTLRCYLADDRPILLDPEADETLESSSSHSSFSRRISSSPVRDACPPSPSPSTSSTIAYFDNDPPDFKPRISNCVGPRLEFSVRLIDLIKNRRCLYDGKTPGGGSSTLRLQMWDGLARQLEYEEGGFQLQKRWKQIRDKYVKERRLPCTTWPLFSKLTFLEPFIGERDRSSSPALHLRPRGPISPLQAETFNRRVIRAVRRYPILYSRSDPNYSNHKRRTEAWKSVLTILNFPCDLGEIQRHWKGLRDRYIRIRRSLREPSSDGSSCSQSGSKFPPHRWIHYDDLIWIEPFLEYQQRVKEGCALARQATDRARRGLVAPVDEDDGVVVDYEVDREDVEASLLYEVEQTALLESGVRIDGDTAFATSVVWDIRALPPEIHAQVRASIEAAVQAAHGASERIRNGEERRNGKRKEEGGEELRIGESLEVAREEVVRDTE